MSIWARISASIIVIFALVFAYFTNVEMNETKRRYREATEEPLVDLAHILAAIVADGSTPERINERAIPDIISRARNFPVAAQIYELRKDHSDIEVTITDDRGIVLADSADPSLAGRDFSQWNDIFTTLRGSYGARSSVDPSSGVTTLFVAAPIVVNGKTVGVLSVRKPNHNTNQFIHATQNNIRQLGMALFLIVALVSLALLYYVTRPIKRLTDYVHAVRDRKGVELPALPGGEIRQLGLAFEELREALEGRKYIERYVTTLTHEIKGPITAIRGALEILLEDVQQEPRALFLTNIEREVERIQGLVEKLLALSSLQTSHVAVDEKIQLGEMIHQIREGLSLQLAARKVTIEVDCSRLPVVSGNSFWLREALLNLIQNAVDFSPSGGIVTVRAEGDTHHQVITVEDQGDGIPEWATEKVFNQFFSLPRPESGKRSSGLGLSIVAEVARLHNGSIRLERAAQRGTRGVLELSRSQPKLKE